MRQDAILMRSSQLRSFAQQGPMVIIACFGALRHRKDSC